MGNTQMYWNLLFLFVSSLICSSLCVSRIKLVDNGYIDLVVALTENVPYDQSEIIIENIKEMITAASPVLYKATYNRAYFRRVQILIPTSWKHILADSSNWETVDAADVLIDTPHPKHGDIPYTRQYGGCGEPGERIYLAPNYVATIGQESNHREFGKPGKVFVHEWAHYRYGVFDEYGTPGDFDFPLFYRSQSSHSIQPNVCADAPLNYTIIDISNNSTVCQIDPVTNLYDKNCRFIFSDQFKPTSSLTSYLHLESMVHFCNDNGDLPHNADAPNKHNQMCQNKSVWSVIEKHIDFSDGAYKPSSFILPPTTFHIVRNTGSTRLVMMSDAFSKVNASSGIHSILADDKVAGLANDDQMTTVPTDVNSDTDDESTAVGVVVAVFFSLMVISVFVALITFIVKRVISKRKSYVAVQLRTSLA